MDEYTKTAWAADDVITATKLNHIEDGIEAVTDEVEANNVCFDREREVVEFLKEGRGTSSAIASIVLSSYNTIADKNYDANVTGKFKLIIGNPIATTRNLQIAMATYSRNTSAILTAYPWLSDYVDENLVMQTTITGLLSTSIGTTYSSGSYCFSAGNCNVSTGAANFNFGQFNKVAGNFTTAIGNGLIAETGAQFCVGRANNNKSEDLFEIGNGLADVSTGDITRSNAFRVTFNGDAIAQNSLGIEDGNGGVVSITAAQLQALLSNASPTCLVTMTYDSTNNRYVSDKTAAEVYAAYNAAKSVVFKFSDIGYVMWGGRDHAEAFCPNVHMLYRESAAGDISDPKYIIDGYGPNDITLGMVAPTSADYFIMEIS